MVWCPATHEFLYSRTANVQRWLELGISTSLGTDSSLTGSTNMFEEFRVARKVYREHFTAEIDPAELLRMVTVNPARALMIQDRVGRVAPGLSADLLALERQSDRDPFETLIEASPEDIVLLLQSGRPMFGDRSIAEHFDSLEGCPSHEKVSVGGKPKCIVGNLTGLLERVYEQIGRRFKPDFIPIDEASAPAE
jgi:cytosine/adenosine deaminase-related metal-dependent hydrolase